MAKKFRPLSKVGKVGFRYRERRLSGQAPNTVMKSVRALIVDDSADLIKFVEQNPDTVITLVNGEKILVQEPVGEVVSRVVEFRRRLVADQLHAAVHAAV